jgi:hypothetical protein
VALILVISPPLGMGMVKDCQSVANMG